MEVPLVDTSVRVQREEGDERVYLSTLFAAGETFETDGTNTMVEWLVSAGVRPGHVSMPKEITPSAGDRILRQLWRAIEDGK
jgi:hypothetical protein